MSPLREDVLIGLVVGFKQTSSGRGDRVAGCSGITPLTVRHVVETVVCKGGVSEAATASQAQLAPKHSPTESTIKKVSRRFTRVQEKATERDRRS